MPFNNERFGSRSQGFFFASGFAQAANSAPERSSAFASCARTAFNNWADCENETRAQHATASDNANCRPRFDIENDSAVKTPRLCFTRSSKFEVAVFQESNSQNDNAIPAESKFWERRVGFLLVPCCLR